MRDYLFLGSTPNEEPCAQTGSKEYDYEFLNKLECKALRAQLLRMYPDIPTKGVSLTTMSCPHDFGVYYEVIANYDDEDEESSEMAIKLEGGLPDKWDSEALKYLKEKALEAGLNYPSCLAIKK